MKILLKVIVKDVQGVPDYSFDVIAFLAFVILYELLLAYYVKAIEGMSLKEVMLAE